MKKNKLFIAALLVQFVLGNTIMSQTKKLTAFPGAEGFGRYSTGGRGGDVYHVTNLNDSGNSSLRNGIQAAKGPGTIVFDLSGNIMAKSALNVNKPNNIFDHVTASWSVDETLSCQSNYADPLTVQWCMVTESLLNSHNTKGPQGMGGIIGSIRQSFHHNLYAHHNSRNPKVTGRHCEVDFRNNVICNWGSNSSYDGTVSNMNWVNNYYKAGPATKSNVRNRIFQLSDAAISGGPDNKNIRPEDTEKYKTSLYAEGNYVDGFPVVTANNRKSGIDYTGNASEAKNRALKPFDFPLITEQTTEEVYPVVLKNAGASLVRDVIDKRIVNEVKSGTVTFGKNGIIDSQKDVGGWPELQSKPAPKDTDQDGMPDDWEQQNGLNPKGPADRNGDRNKDGYTNLEEYLNDVSSQSSDQTVKETGLFGIPVLPGVSGFGLDTRGGQGGKIIVVKNLNPNGEGSLAEALAYDGPRIIVFEVAGYIDLNKKSLKIKNPYITIAGQTAPAPGITLIKGGLGIGTHDVIVQHIKVRPGEAGGVKKGGWEVDGIGTDGAYDVIIDHCSTSWSTDENLSASGPRFEGKNQDEWRQNTSHKITISNCIIAQGLSNSTHSKGEHSKGSLIHDNATEILVYGNLYADNVERNPFFKGGVQGSIVNNFIYNPGKAAIHYALVESEWEGHEWITGKMSVEGNYIEYGPNTSEKIAAGKFYGPVEVYWKDNMIVTKNPVKEFSGNPIIVEKRPVWPYGLVPYPASEVKKLVLQTAGAFPWARDEIDKMIIAGARNGNGKIIDCESEAGGYPIVKPAYKKFNPEDWDMVTLTKKIIRK
jgi:hypothetical protein